MSLRAFYFINVQRVESMEIGHTIAYCALSAIFWLLLRTIDWERLFNSIHKSWNVSNFCWQKRLKTICLRISSKKFKKHQKHYKGIVQYSKLWVCLIEKVEHLEAFFLFEKCPWKAILLYSSSLKLIASLLQFVLEPLAHFSIHAV